jgi:hypothetical protein
MFSNHCFAGRKPMLPLPAKYSGYVLKTARAKNAIPSLFAAQRADHPSICDDLMFIGMLTMGTLSLAH